MTLLSSKNYHKKETSRRLDVRITAIPGRVVVQPQIVVGGPVGCGRAH